uniref:Uncharacterized protein n=1 Tax=Acidithiobacillus ferrianus TaxID=2678518 RepID=A0A845UMS7_9PROT|nr:RhuM family protein [Acidithiobacillus ferrianus]NDU42898.1 hypothetical protein [Acidithiobacillus ferrianus]
MPCFCLISCTRGHIERLTGSGGFLESVTDIYATSVDYDARHSLTQQFFATVQNKVHYAIHGQTAAELITSRANTGDSCLCGYGGRDCGHSAMASGTSSGRDAAPRNRPLCSLKHGNRSRPCGD